MIKNLLSVALFLSACTPSESDSGPEVDTDHGVIDTAVEDTDMAPDTGDTDVAVDTDDTASGPVVCENVMVVDSPVGGDLESVLTNVYVDGLQKTSTQVLYERGVTVVTEFVHDELGRALMSTSVEYPCTDCTSYAGGTMTQFYAHEYMDDENAVRETTIIAAIPDLNRVETYWLNDASRPIRVESDWPMGGGLDGIQTYTYDEHGNMTSSAWDDPRGMLDSTLSTWEYDSQDRMIRAESDFQVMVFDYAEDGSTLIVTQEWAPITGTPDSIQYMDLDSAGRVIKSQYDMDANGVMDYITYKEFDSDGNLVLMEDDWDADGTLDGSERFVYDVSGLIISDVTDSSPYDGTPDWSDSWTYDTYGRVLTTWSESTPVFGQPVDGIPDQTRTWTYGCNP